MKIRKTPGVIVSTLVVALLLAVTVIVPSCRQHKSEAHDAHYAHIDSLLRACNDADSLARLARVYHDAQDATGEMLALKYQGRVLRHQSRFDEAIEVHTRGLNVAIAASDTLEMMAALNNIGTDYRREGDLSKANGFHYKALQLSNAYSDHSCPEAVKMRVKTLNGIGNIEIELRHYATADSVLREALQGERSLNSDLGMAINYSNLGAIKRAQGQTDSAWVYYRESLKHNQLAGDEGGIALCHLSFGELYADDRNFSRAQVEYRQAYEKLKELGDTYHQLEACLSLADVNIRLGEHEDALRYAQEAEAEALRINSKEHQARAYHLYYEMALQAGKHQDALNYYVKSDALYDSIYGLEKSNEMRSQRAEYETNVKMGEMSTLNNDIAHQKRLRNMMILFTVLLLAMAGAIILALLYASRVRTRTQHLMRQVEETRSLFFTNVVHQLRTPLTAIMGATDAIIAQAKNSSSTEMAQQRENVEIIERQGNHLLLLVDRILEVGGVRSAIKGPDWRTGDVVGYLRMIVESYYESSVERHIELTYAPQEKEVVVDIVPYYLNTIVGSLIENAISYSNDYGKVMVTSRVEDDNLIIRVADNGMGISEKDLPHVFEAFYRADAAEQLCEGVGIGLTVVRDMTNVMGGKVDVESTLGKRTAFTVTLPCRSSHPGVKQNLEMVVEPVRTVVRKPNENNGYIEPLPQQHGLPVVLVVEDHSDVAHLIGAALYPGYTVHYAYDGEQGLARAKELIPDLIITDVKMPLMDGLELCRRVRATRALRHIPLLMLSARTSGQDRIRGIEAGADVYMVKPFAADEIKIIVDKLLENRKMLKQAFSDSLDATIKVEASARKAAMRLNDDDFLDAFVWQVDRMLRDGVGRMNMDNLASRLGMGEASMKSRVLKLTGKNVAAYIGELRMAKALKLLKEHTNMSVTEVAMQCGFSEVAYFSRAFRQFYNMSPTEARRRRRVAPPDSSADKK